jgi:hypothetical protein
MNPAVSRQIAVIAFSQLEEEFFAAGERLANELAPEDFADLDAGHRAPSVWRLLWSWLRPAQRCTSE